MTGVEAGGRGIRRGEHAARFAGGRLGVLQGCKTFLLQDADGQIEPTHSVVGRGLTMRRWGLSTRFTTNAADDFAYATDDEVLAAFQLCSRHEGIIPALRIDACAGLRPEARKGFAQGQDHHCEPGGRGDKDVQQVQVMLTNIK